MFAMAVRSTKVVSGLVLALALASTGVVGCGGDAPDEPDATRAASSLQSDLTMVKAPVGVALEAPAEVKDKPRAAAVLAAPSAPKPKRKLSFAESHALKTLPGRIEKLTTEQKRLEEILSAPDLYRKDPTAFTKATMALAMVKADLGKAEEDWLRTELLREELERG